MVTDWLHKQQLLELLTITFSGLTVALLVAIMASKAVFMIMRPIKDQLRAKYLGFITSAIDANISGFNTDYNRHIEKLSAAMRRKQILNTVHEILYDAKNSLSGNYYTAVLDLTKRLPQQHLSFEKKKYSVPRLLYKIKTGFFSMSKFKRNQELNQLIEILELRHEMVQGKNHFTEMDKVKIFQELSNIDKSKFPDLKPAFAFKDSEIISFLGQLIGKFKLTEHLENFIVSVENLGLKNNVLVAECLENFHEEDELLQLNKVLVKSEHFFIKKQILSHIKSTCL